MEVKTRSTEDIEYSLPNVHLQVREARDMSRKDIKCVVILVVDLGYMTLTSLALIFTLKPRIQDGNWHE